MNKKKAMDILSDDITPENGLIDWAWYGYIDWCVGGEEVTLSGKFTAEKLEAIAWWMRNH